MRLILASKSPSRAALLRAAGVAFETRGSGVNEEPLKARWLTEARGPREIAEGLAEAKALAVSSAEPGAWVIGGDQTLDLDGELFDKPADPAQARAHLLRLRGRTHRLHCAVVIARGGEVVWRATPASILHVRDFTDSWLESYLAQAGDAVLESVGAYQLEGLGVQLFDRIEGDWFAILGLPMVDLLAALRREGVLVS